MGISMLLEGFAPPPPAQEFPDSDFTSSDRVRVSVKGGKSVVGRVVRPHGGTPPTHAIIAPEGGGAHVKAPVGDVKLDTPAQHALERKREAAAAMKQAQQAPGPGAVPGARQPAALPLGKPPPHPGTKPSPVREGIGMMLEAFNPPLETPQQSQVRGAAQAAAAQKQLAAGYKTWNPSKHPRAGGGKFGYTTGGKRATRATSRRHSTRSSSSRTSTPRVLGQGSQGALVKSLQRQLHIPADGKYGPQTQAAVTNYQKQHGLQVDGVIGRQTLAALRGNVNARAIAPGPITSKQATIKASRTKSTPASRAAAKQQRVKLRAQAKSNAQLRMNKANFAGGTVV
jgi:peptidoglycan hydrolase-like protein with peptidoglycan-binding domain